MTDWDKRMMDLARHIGGWSKDRSRGVGCVIANPLTRVVLAMGYNGFPRGCDDECEAHHARPAKYVWTEHAERNAIYNAARTGTALQDSVMYLPWYPCTDCARAIVQSGVLMLVATEPDWNDPKWGEEFHVVKQLFDEVSFNVLFVT